jgi:uncharacterized protein YvpB
MMGAFYNTFQNIFQQRTHPSVQKVLTLVFLLGLTLGALYALSFFTEKKTVTLDVPYFRQQHLNSCEASALRMALGYYKIETNDMEIVKAVGYEPRVKDYDRNIWDDPQEMFVGYIDDPTGYGVYGKPIARAGEKFGRSTTYYSHVTPTLLARSIEFGNPVVIWGHSGITRAPYTWKTNDGNTVKAFGGEHARVVVGYSGQVFDPDGFYVHDPQTGEQSKYWTTAALMKNINAVPGVTNQAVVVK